MINYKNLINLTETKKPIQIVKKIEERYEIKKSSLSLSARNKVVNKTGSNYASENRQTYGPGIWSERIERTMDGIWEVTKTTGKIAAATAVTATVGPVIVAGGIVPALIIGGSIATEGYMLKEATKEGIFGNNKSVKETTNFVGDCVESIGFDIMTVGLVSTAKNVCKTYGK